MLAKKFRLPIQSVFSKKGQSVKTNYFLVKIFPNQLSYPRVGVVVSKKVDARATKRNKLRRMIFSEIENCFQKQKACLPAGRDFLIIVSPSFANLAKTDAEKRVKEIFDKLK